MFTDEGNDLDIGVTETKTEESVLAPGYLQFHNPQPAILKLEKP